MNLILLTCFLFVLSNAKQLSYVSTNDYSQSIRQSTSSKIVRNVGLNFVPPGTKPKRYSGTITTVRPGIPAFNFRTGVEANSFSIKFPLKPGTYDVELGFVQTVDCVAGTRIFNVYINGKLREESFDVFAAAGCSKGIVNRYNRQIIDPISDDGITLSFETVSGIATLSYLRIQESNRPCVPEVSVSSASSASGDHYAHAVPGTYPDGDEASYVDRSGRGFYRVRIDGSGSHTHFTFRNYTARLKTYEWTREDTGKVISNSPRFWYNFPLGTTVLRLKVTDTVCSDHEETTSITVTGNLQQGVICYLYEDQQTILPGGKLKSSFRPTLSFVSRSLNIKFPTNAFPKKRFGARCIFMIMFPRASDNTKISVDTSNSGVAHLYQGDDRIFDTASAGRFTTIANGDGYMEYEITYRYKNLQKSPTLSLKVNNSIPSVVSFDSATTLPIITSVSPNSGSSAGGTEVRIFGYNLYRPVVVFFGNTRATLRGGQTPKSTEVSVMAPPSSGSNSVPVKVRTGMSYISNEVVYTYGNTCDDVNFDNTQIRDRSGNKVVVTQPTAMTIGQDGDLYVGTLEGRIQKITFDHETHVMQSMCHSEVFQDSKWKNRRGKIASRAFLGIALDPRDTVPRPYVSASTLFYNRREFSISPTNKRAWSNGAIERFKPASAATKARDPRQCLEHDTNIVEGLPVANGDHSVNQLIFTQNGDLVVAVGGNTNMGLPNSKLGGNWETYFSGAVLIARLSKSTFNGKIPYTTPENLRTARPKGNYKDVDLYATGLRNPFTMTMSRAGRIYVADMGPNRGFGDASSKCSEYDEKEAAALPPNANVTGSGAVFGTGPLKYSDSRADKLVLIEEGKYYGHPNLQRSAHLGVDECAYIDPETGKTPPPGRKSPPSNYKHRLALLKSPITGVLEYGGNEFCGKMKGNLIFAKLKSQGTLSVAMKANGSPSGNAYQLHQLGGLAAVEDSTGALIFAKFSATPTDGFIVLKPRVSNRPGLFLSGAVPFRHGKKGRTNLHIGGRGFSSSAVVSVGRNVCRNVNVKTGKIVCKVPAHSGGGRLVDVVVRDGSKSATLKNAVLYMTV